MRKGHKLGWLFYHKDSKEKPIDNLRRECFSPIYLSEHGYSIIGEASSKGVCHFAVKRAIEIGDEKRFHLRDGQTDIVTAVIILHQRGSGNHNFGYKDMDEFCGPYEASAPASFINKLTPLKANPEDYRDSIYSIHDRSVSAAVWRQACLNNAAKKRLKLKAGQIVKLPYKVSFRKLEEDTFEVVVYPAVGRRRARTVFKSRSTGFVCRLTVKTKADLSIVS